MKQQRWDRAEMSNLPAFDPLTTISMLLFFVREAEMTLLRRTLYVAK